MHCTLQGDEMPTPFHSSAVAPRGTRPARLLARAATVQSKALTTRLCSMMALGTAISILPSSADIGSHTVPIEGLESIDPVRAFCDVRANRRKLSLEQEWLRNVWSFNSEGSRDMADREPGAHFNSVTATQTRMSLLFICHYHIIVPTIP